MKLRGNLIIESKFPSPLFIIKPDQNFHIYIHGTPELIEQNEDKKKSSTKYIIVKIKIQRHECYKS